MLERTTLPALNASLNALSTIFIVAGIVFVRRQEIKKHKVCMIIAAIISALFLSSYVAHHAQFGSTRFTAEGWIRPIYLILLATHILLAALNLPMILGTLYFAWRGALDKHRRLARWTWPVWLYVSVTGVLVYLLLYQVYPSADLGG